MAKTKTAKSIRPSKENATKAIAHIRKLRGGVTIPPEADKFLMEFMERVRSRLPTEASFDREQARRQAAKTAEDK